MNGNHADLLPVVRAADLEDANPEHRWLVESLWTRAGVGFIAGAPKLGLCRARHNPSHAASPFMPRRWPWLLQLHA